MDKYYKMCVAAKLNYYRKVPDMEDLQRISGLSTVDFLRKFQIYTFSRHVVHKLFDTNSDDTIEEITLKMVMNIKGNFIWNGERWIT